MAPKVGKTVLTWQKENYFCFSFSSFLAFKQLKADIPLWHRLQIFCCCHFRVTVKISETLSQVKNWGRIGLNMTSVHMFFKIKNHSTLIHCTFNLFIQTIESFAFAGLKFVRFLLVSSNVKMLYQVSTIHYRHIKKIILSKDS